MNPVYVDVGFVPFSLDVLMSCLMRSYDSQKLVFCKTFGDQIIGTASFSWNSVNANKPALGMILSGKTFFAYIGVEIQIRLLSWPTPQGRGSEVDCPHNLSL